MSNRNRFYAGDEFRLKKFANIYKFSIDNIANCEQIIVKKKDGDWEYYANIDPSSIDEFTAFYLFFNEFVSKKISFSELFFLDEKGESQS